VNQQSDPIRSGVPRQRWYVVDRTGQAVSIGYRQRDRAEAELDAIAAALRRELQRLGRSPSRINTQVAGFSLGATHAPIRTHRGMLRSDRPTGAVVGER
jgi:hypothetical protein